VTNSALLFSSLDCSDTPPPQEVIAVVAEQFVRQPADRLSDAELERHIKSCAYLMEDAMQRWYDTGCFSHRGEADRWRLLMEEGIKSRSPAQVRRMERERGLSGR
jgi:hypothetical protein